MNKLCINVIAFSLASCALLTACGHKRDKNEILVDKETSISQNDSCLENTIPTVSRNGIEKSNKEEEIINYFRTIESEIYNYFSLENIGDLKENIKKSIIDGIDFIFYGKEIKGVTFEELSEETKEKITRIVSQIDILIESKNPGYKEELKSSFGKFKDAAKNNILNIDAALKNSLGDSYDDLKELIESTGELGIDIAEIGLESLDLGSTYIKKWYENETDKR